MKILPNPINPRLASRRDYEHYALSCQRAWSGGLWFWLKARKSNNPEPEWTDSKGGSCFDWNVAIMVNNPEGSPIPELS